MQRATWIVSNLDFKSLLGEDKLHEHIAEAIIINNKDVHRFPLFSWFYQFFYRTSSGVQLSRVHA